MKVYTGTGDRGKTSLFSGERIEKSNPRVEAYGDVDELNALIGAILNVLPEGSSTEAAQLDQVMIDLFQMGACLATTPGSPNADAFSDLPTAKITWLEEAIDRMDADLPRLTRFVLPAGHPAASACHLARCVCRRAERRVVHVCLEAEDQGGDPPYRGVRGYLNRLSDYLFVMARYCNHITNTPERTWGG